MKITGFRIQILLRRSKIELTEVISSVVTWSVHLHFPNTFLYLFHNYDITNLENIYPITFSKYAKDPIKVLLKRSTCSFKNL